MLRAAKGLGDVLIVGVNTDSSVRALKGPKRPVNRLEDRLDVLSELAPIDHLIAFEELNPEALIRRIRPDVFVKGGDYSFVSLPEANLVRALGGEVRIIEYLPEQSTSATIRRIEAGAASARVMPV
jgi:rfaE bifunctional protein nucleotidyltransferase chain/domain